MAKKKNKYFPNNWDAYNEVDPEMFEDLPFDQFMDWKVAGWELPSSVTCIIREKNLRTGKIKEHVYSRPSAAKKKVSQLMDEGEAECTVCNHDTIHHMYPKYMEESPYDDPLV